MIQTLMAQFGPEHTSGLADIDLEGGQAFTGTIGTVVHEGNGDFSVEVEFDEDWNGIAVWVHGGATAREEVNLVVPLDTEGLTNAVEALTARTQFSLDYSGPMVSADRIELVAGDDYLLANGKALTWNTDLDLTEGVVELTISDANRAKRDVDVVGAYADGVITVELPAAITETFVSQLTNFNLHHTDDDDLRQTLALGSAKIYEVGE